MDSPLRGGIAKEQRKGKSWPDGRPKLTPLVVQVVGEHDGWVDPDDSRDILAFPSGHEIGVRNANHRNLFRLDLAPNPDGRYAMLREAFVGQFRDDPWVESTVHRVIFILHGIRARTWKCGSEA